MEVSLRKARTIVRKTLEKGREMELKPLAVVVLDAGGHVKAFEREDGASPGRFGVAHGKAYGSVMLGTTCTALKQRADADPSFIAAVNGVFGGQLVPVPGGVLVKDKKGAIVASVGVSGDTSDNDLAAAMAGVEAAGLQGEG